MKSIRIILLFLAMLAGMNIYSQPRFINYLFGDKKLHYARFQVDSLSAIVNVLVQDTSKLSKKLRKVSRTCNELESEHESLKKKYYHLMEESLSQTDLLTQALEERPRELKEKEQLIRKRERALSDLKEIVRMRDSATAFLNDTLAAILWDFDTEEINIEKKNGVLELTLYDKIMFDPGSSDIYGKGKKALQRIVPVMKAYPEMDIEVEGHTDSIPISTSRFADNWDLSTSRALAVVRYLKSLGLAKKRFTATGKADNEPVATNKTEEGRKQNRRIVLRFSILGEELEKTKVPAEFLDDQLIKSGAKNGESQE
jgi:chemotaxis protein MotB